MASERWQWGADEYPNRAELEAGAKGLVEDRLMEEGLHEAFTENGQRYRIVIAVSAVRVDDDDAG